MTLTEFLLARIAEDEADAADLWRCPYADGIRGDWPHVTSKRAMAECETKRQIVEACILFDDESTSGAALGHRVLSALALPYADHPDFQQEWRP